VRRATSMFVPFALVVMVAACGGGSATSAPAASVPAASVPAASVPAAGGSTVTIVDFAFNPADLSVKAGTEVTWTNTGATSHTVKLSDGTPESDRLAPAATYKHTFATAGTVAYVCGIHASMKGTITVT
jgi:plastocyanin